MRAIFPMKTTILLFLAMVGSATAQIKNYTFSGVIVSSALPSAFTVGDPYKLSFDLDFSAIDISGSPKVGIFAGAVSNLSFSLGGTAAGSYSGGSMSAKQFLQLNDGANGYDMVNFYASDRFIKDPAGLSFPSADGFAFAEIAFSFYTSKDLFSVPAGGGETLGSVLPSLDLKDYDNTVGTFITFDNWTKLVSGDISTISNGAVPEPSTYGIGACVFLMILVSMRKRKIT
jgi:hypothetical protein